MTIPASATLCAHEGAVPFYSYPAFDALPFIRHGISTRLGGVSRGTWASMNLSFTRGDDEQAVRENFRRFCGAVGVDPTHVVIPYQSHTTNLVNVTHEHWGDGVTREKTLLDVDGVLTDEPDVVLCTQYADCNPLLFVDPKKRVIASSHAGWRGTADEMARVTVERMHTDYGCEPRDILAGIGPSIGKCCFEVDEPVAEIFRGMKATDDACILPGENGKFFVDLWRVNRLVMLAAGLTEDHITVTDICTRCHPMELWSYRYCGKERGSLASVLCLMPE